MCSRHRPTNGADSGDVCASHEVMDCPLCAPERPRSRFEDSHGVLLSRLLGEPCRMQLCDNFGIDHEGAHTIGLFRRADGADGGDGPNDGPTAVYVGEEGETTEYLVPVVEPSSYDEALAGLRRHEREAFVEVLIALALVPMAWADRARALAVDPKAPGPELPGRRTRL